MKMSGSILLLFACLSCCLHAQKTRYAESLPRAKPGVSYPIKVHISAIRLRTDCHYQDAYRHYQEGCQRTIYADTILNGQKVEISGFSPLTTKYNIPLLPGEYQARFLKDPHFAVGTPLCQEFEILLPDGTVWKCSVTGISE